MKIEWNKKYTTIAIYAGVVILLGIVGVFLAIRFSDLQSIFQRFYRVCKPLIYGFAFAYLLCPILNFHEKKVYAFLEKKRPRKKLKRILSLISTYLWVALFLTLFSLIVIPQVSTSFNSLQERMASYVQAAQAWVNEILSESEFLAGQYEKLTASINGLIEQSYEILSAATPYITAYATTFVEEVKNSLLGIILSVYFLLSKEQLLAQTRKIMYAFLPESLIHKITHVAQLSHKTFGGFISGKIMDSGIVGILCYIGMSILGMPYAPLISVIIGVTDVIPFFGPFLGAIPSIFILFLSDPMAAVLFAVLILVLQQIDGNLIAPLILGDKTGLSAHWVVIAITVMGGFFGILGMFIGVPVFAVIYVLIKEKTEDNLCRKGLPAATRSYYDNAEYTEIYEPSPKRSSPERKIFKKMHIQSRSACKTPSSQNNENSNAGSDDTKEASSETWSEDQQRKQKNSDQSDKKE